MKIDKRMFRRMFEKEDRNNQIKLIAIAEKEKREDCKKFLDIGCGDGTFTLEFARAIGAKEVYGVDIYEPAIAKAIKKGMIVKKANLNEKIPFSSDFFDVILCNQVAEHLLNADKLFEEINRVLKLGGVGYISVPNLCAFHNRIFILLGWQPTVIWPSTKFVFGNPAKSWRLSGIMEYKHLTAFSPSAFKEMLGFYGLKLKNYYGSGMYPFSGKTSELLSVIFPTFSVFQTAVVVKREAKRK